MHDHISDDTLQDTSAIAGLVSVTLTVYNGSPWVAEAIESVLAQTYQPLELIVVDDGSTDDSWRILQSYGERIRSYRQSNGGPSVARNAAIRHARGEFIAVMDHDDICEPDRIALQVAFLRAHPQVGLCCSDFSAFDRTGPIADSYIGVYYSSCAPENGGPLAHYPDVSTLDLSAVSGQVRSPQSVRIAKGAVYEQLAHGNFAHPPTVMVRASVLSAAGLFDPSTRSVSDWDWLVRISQVTEFGYIDRSLLRHRRPEIQSSSIKARDTLDALALYRLMCARDPELLRRRRESLRHQLGQTAIDAAYSNAEARPWLALWLLLEATVRYRVVSSLSRPALLKALMPNSLLGWVRQRRALGV